MMFEWNEAKRNLNIKKHGIDFRDVIDAFDSPMVTGLDTREDYGEERWVGIGLIRNIVIVIAFIEKSDDKIRIISARRATKYEREKYYKTIEDQLD